MKSVVPESPEQTARKLRRRLGIDNLTWIDPMTVLQKLARLIPGFSFKLVSAEELGGKLARWDSSKKQIVICDELFFAANEQRQEGRARYSLFHEVVHALEGHVGVFYRDTSRANIPIYAKKLRALERSTDQITAALMAPKHLILAEYGPSDIAFRFGMSLRAAEIRWSEIRRSD